jgi:hypothetical protein
MDIVKKVFFTQMKKLTILIKNFFTGLSAGASEPIRGEIKV